MGNPDQLCDSGVGMKIRIFEIFNSISGEVGLIPQGALATFVRFAGCNLKCTWCDTEVTQSPLVGRAMEVSQILVALETIGCPNIVLTGGEPLLQKDGLCRLVEDIKINHPDWIVQIETNGTYPIPSGLDRIVDCWVVDYKLPGAKTKSKQSRLLSWLPEGSWVKFVCTDRKDFDKAIEVIKKSPDWKKVRLTFAFSAVSPSLKHTQLIEWLRELKMWGAVVNIQIHKVIEVK